MPELLPESILVATDLTESSDRLVAAAAGLAHAFGADLRVLHALEPNDRRYTPDEAVSPSFAASLAEAVRLLDTQVRLANVHPDVRVSRQVVIRTPAKAILELAGTGFDLIVLGGHRKGGSGLRLGSTAKRVISESPIPCLIVGPRAELPIRRVAVAHDLSQVGRRALEIALRWAAVSLPGPTDGEADDGSVAGRLDVVHVVNSRGQSARDAADHPGLLEREISAVLQETPGAERLRIHPVVLIGDAAQRIAGFAASNSADLIVAGIHGGSLLHKVALGSVASGLTDRALRFVLLIPSHHRDLPDGYRSRPTQLSPGLRYSP